MSSQDLVKTLVMLVNILSAEANIFGRCESIQFPLPLTTFYMFPPLAQIHKHLSNQWKTLTTFRHEGNHGGLQTVHLKMSIDYTGIQIR